MFFTLYVVAMVIKTKVTENFTGNAEKSLSTASKENPNCSKPIGIALSGNDCIKPGEEYSLDDLIYRFANGNYGYAKLLAAWFGNCGEKYKTGITIKSFVEELYRIRDDMIKANGDTRDITTIIRFSVEELYRIRDDMIKANGDTIEIDTIILRVLKNKSLLLGKRLTESQWIDWMINEFVRDVSHKETVKRWFDTKKSQDGISYRKGITIKYFMDELFKIKSHIENNKKESRWVDVILCDIWKYALYGHI